MNDRDDRLEELLAEFVERRERGERLTASEFAAEHPDLDADLRPALERLERTASLLPAGDLPPFLGPYRIEARLGSGGTGEVFAARTEDGREVAIKCLLPHVRLQPRAVERLRREGAVLQTIDHPGVVKIETTGVGDGNVFLVMERIDGGSLAQMLQQARQRPDARISEHRAIELTALLARALAEAHSRGLLHRDLKPGNVLLRSDGRPVLVDFGLALDPDAGTLTRTGDVLGTPNYMSPEQALGQQASEQSDVYGLAAILYELVTLQPPHQGTDALQVLSAVRDSPPRPARRIEPAVSPRLERVLRRALAWRPGSRWLSAEQFAAALEALLAGRQPAGATISLHQRALEFWLWHKRAVLAIASGIAIAGLAFALWQGLSAAHLTRTGEAIEGAITAYLDDGADGRRAAAELLDEFSAEPALARWFAGDGPGNDPYVQALDRGVELRRQRPAEAVVAFEQALAIRTDLPLAGALLGITASAVRDYELAERELTTAMRSLTDCTRVRRELGTVLRRRGDFAGAATVWRELTTRWPDEAQYWFELGRACLKSKDSEEALAALDRALTMHDGEPPVQWMHARGAVLDSLDRRSEGIALMRDIVARHPSPNTWNSLGLIYDKEHRLHEAADAYRNAIAIDSAHVPSLYALAHLHAGSDRATCERCKACFEESPELFDQAEVSRLALLVLAGQHGKFTHAEPLAAAVIRAGGSVAFAQKLDELLEQDFDNAALGNLLRARKQLR